MINKYRIRCITEDMDIFVISDSIPAVCPNDVAHEIDNDSLVMMKSDISINDGTLKSLSLAEYKQLRYNEIDAKTLLLLSAGFTYNSKTFGLATHQMIYWNTLHKDRASLTYPYNITTMTKETYSLTDQPDLEAFYAAAFNTVESIETGARSLHQAIFDAADEAAVDVVVDNRS